MEERKITRYQVVRDACGLVQDVDLAIEYVLGLLVCVLRDVASGTGLNAVEARCEVSRVILGLGLNAGSSSARV